MPCATENGPASSSGSPELAQDSWCCCCAAAPGLASPALFQTRRRPCTCCRTAAARTTTAAPAEATAAGPVSSRRRSRRAACRAVHCSSWHGSRREAQLLGCQHSMYFTAPRRTAPPYDSSGGLGDGGPRTKRPSYPIPTLCAAAPGTWHTAPPAQRTELKVAADTCER
jgi:hypothetical protein